MSCVTIPVHRNNSFVLGPVKVKEMGFVDFLLQDCNPDYFSDVSCNTSIPSQHSHHADLSGMVCNPQNKGTLIEPSILYLKVFS